MHTGPMFIFLRNYCTVDNLTFLLISSRFFFIHHSCSGALFNHTSLQYVQNYNTYIVDFEQLVVSWPMILLPIKEYRLVAPVAQTHSWRPTFPALSLWNLCVKFLLPSCIWCWCHHSAFFSFFTVAVSSGPVAVLRRSETMHS